VHSFCTNDIMNLPMGRGCEAYLCNAKGKILAQVVVLALADELWLDAAPGLEGKIISHLERYVIAEDVTLRAGDRPLVHIVLAGPTAHQVLGLEAEALGQLDVRAIPFAGVGCQAYRHDLLGVPCFHLYWPGAQGRTLWDYSMQAGVVPARPECYETLRVEAGYPEYGKDIDESNYPQEVNRIPQTVSFTKGCYLGQEPIVMIRDRGQVQRVLRGLKLDSSAPAPAGSRIVSAGVDVGKVTSSVLSPRVGSAIALGYVRRSSQEPGTVVEVEVGERARVPAVVTKLPFV
jgi:folate-binding protein YgfZ